MTHERPERRARGVALIGLVFEILMAAFLSVLAVWSGSEATRALAQLAMVGIFIWLTIVLIYHQRVLVREEDFESEQLRKEREAGLVTGAVFDTDDEALLLARRRLRWMYRWVLPGSAILVIALLIVQALVSWNWSLLVPVSAGEWQTLSSPELVIWFMAGAAFLCFLLSRYAIGMARQPEWQMLRAGAAYLMGLTLGAAAIVAALGAMLLSDQAAPWVVPEHLLAYGLRYLMLALAVEFVLNLVLDFYRPRQPDEEPRPAFDSRLLGLFTEPGGIARSIADAINYQFGFEVSSTWFYKLIERSAVPLVGFGALMLMAATCFVFVGQEQEVVVERFGKRQEPTLGPGLHLKLPWPVDRAYRVSTGRYDSMRIGKESEQEDKSKKELILWTNQHSQEPHLLVLVATPKLAEFIDRAAATRPATSLPGDAAAVEGTAAATGRPADTSQAVPVSQLRVSMTLEYQVREPYHWLTTYADPRKMLEALANREIVRYFASVDVAGALGKERERIERDLRQAIQAETERADLGVNIVYLGLQGVHPPVEAAEAFQEVIGAEQRKAATVAGAETDSNKRLSEAAGDKQRALDLDKAIREASRLGADPNASPAVVEAAVKNRDVLFLGDQTRRIRPVGGEAISRVAQARAERWRLENDAHGQAVAFEQERALKNIAPKVYAMRRYLTAIGEAVQGVRKFVIATKARQNPDTFLLDIRDPMQAPLGSVLEKKN